MEGGAIGPITYRPTIYDEDTNLAFYAQDHARGAHILVDTAIMIPAQPVSHVYNDMALTPWLYTRNNIGTGRCVGTLHGPTEVSLSKDVEHVLAVESSINSGDVAAHSSFDGFYLNKPGTYLFTVSIAATQKTLYGYTFFYFKDKRTNEQFGRSGVLPTSDISMYHSFSAIVHTDRPETVQLCVFSQREVIVGATSTLSLLPTVIVGTRIGREN
jgi:hypothetical protein